MRQRRDWRPGAQQSIRQLKQRIHAAGAAGVHPGLEGLQARHSAAG
jgi:hypothetical protein